jgi:hypothetical protein
MAVHDFSRIERSSNISHELAVKTKWWKVCVYLALAALLIYLMILGSLKKQSIFLLLAALASIYFAAVIGYRLVKSWIAGYQVLICKEGLFLAQFGKINWASIVGIDLKTVDTRSQSKVLFLAIADIKSYQHFTQSLWKKLLWQGIGFDQKKSVIRLPLIFPKGDLEAFIKAAKAMANDYGGRLYASWYEQMPIHDAIEAKTIENQEREIFARLDLEQKTVFKFLKSAEFLALSPEAQKALAEEKMKSLNALAEKQSAVVERRVKHSKDAIDRIEKTLKGHLRGLKWINNIGIFLFAIWLIALIFKYVR